MLQAASKERVIKYDVARTGHNTFSASRLHRNLYRYRGGVLFSADVVAEAVFPGLGHCAS